jgi:hypothetical protein
MGIEEKREKGKIENGDGNGKKDEFLDLLDKWAEDDRNNISHNY